jgi:hypothetical protein
LVVFQIVAPQLTINSTVNASISVPVIMEYNVTVPINTDAAYTVKVDSTTSQRFKVCSININYQGINIPCLNPPSAPVYAPDGSASWALGRIRNAGQRSPLLDPQANTVQFIIVVLPLNVPSNAVGTTAIIQTTLTYGTNPGTVMSTNVLLVANSVSLTVKINYYLYVSSQIFNAVLRLFCST